MVPQGAEMSVSDTFGKVDRRIVDSGSRERAIETKDEPVPFQHFENFVVMSHLLPVKIGATIIVWAWQFMPYLYFESVDTNIALTPLPYVPSRLLSYSVCFDDLALGSNNDGLLDSCLDKTEGGAWRVVMDPENFCSETESSVSNEALMQWIGAVSFAYASQHIGSTASTAPFHPL